MLSNFLYDDSSDKKQDVIYARVSSPTQKSQGNLDKHIQFLIDKNTDLKNVLILSEVGSSLNNKRNKLQ